MVSDGPQWGKDDDAVAWINLGLAYDRADRTSDAIAAFQRVIKIRHSVALLFHPMAWRNLGNAYRKAGRMAEANAAFEKARELDPSVPPVR